VENLVEKGILKENGKLDLPGQPMSYITTDKFLTVFGLSSLDDLPSQLKEDLNKFNKTDDGNT
jgi:segregation and condensation protein B